MKFIHTADIHLDSPMRGLERYEGAPVEELRHATRRAFENMISLAIDESVDFLLIAGDLYDGTWHDYKTGLFFTKSMKQLTDCGIPAFIISGNHDAQSKMTKSLRQLPNVHLFSHKKAETHHLDHLGVAIHGQSYDKPAVFDNIAASYPSAEPGLFNIGILHTSLNGREGHEPYAPCTTNHLQSRGYDYWALGHVHSREIICKHPAIVFPGNLQGRHFREYGTKSCSLVDSGADEVDVIEKPTDVARWLTLDIETGDSLNLDDVLGRIVEQLENESQRTDGRLSIFRIIVTGDCRAHSTLIRESDRFLNEVRNATLGCFGDRAWVEQVIVRTNPYMQLEAPDAAGPIARMVHRLENLKSDDAIMDALKREILSLKSELPTDVFDADHFLEVERQQDLSRMTTEVRDCLLSLLTSGEER